MSTVEVRRRAGALGAEVTGVDIADVDDATFAALHDALLEHLVLCVKGQAHATPDDQVAFTARWGRIEPHPYVPPIEGHPEIIEIYDPNPITVTWHSDFTYAKQPPSVSLLLGRIIPPVGGDTMFSNGYLAYEGLSDGLRATVDSLRAVHHATQLAIDSGMPDDEIVNSHPVACTHPETGRRALFVNDNYTKHFDGWSVDDSQPLLDLLYAQFDKPEHTFRHRWEEGDLLIWDNRCAQHSVVGDTDGARRSLHRTTVAGAIPV
jgi:taurine dioxygenase